MNKKTSKSGVVATIVIIFVLIILLTILTFAIPFNKINEGVHFTAYFCAEFVLIAMMILMISQLFMEENRSQRIISLPIIYFAYITVIIQLFATGIFYLANAFISLPLWIVLVVECFIIGFGTIQITKGFFFKERNKEYHENIANTKFMDEYRARLKALQRINKNGNIDKVLSDLVDIALGSDPITNDKTFDSEGELLSLLQELDEAIKDGSEDNVRLIIEKSKNTLLERNTLCKIGK